MSDIEIEVDGIPVEVDEAEFEADPEAVAEQVREARKPHLLAEAEVLGLDPITESTDEDEEVDDEAEDLDPEHWDDEPEDVDPEEDDELDVDPSQPEVEYDDEGDDDE